MFLPRLTILFLAFATMMSAEPPGCKIRITSKGLDMLKYETQKFVEEELENITVPDLKGKEGGLQYTIQDVKIQELNLTYADLRFQPDVGLLFDIQNSSISLTFQRHILYWFLHDVGAINASADGVNIHVALYMTRDDSGRLKISNMSCDAAVAKMRAKFSGTLGKVYEFLASFLTTGMRFILNQQICPTLNHAGLVLINSLLDTVPVRQTVDKYVGIDYALLSDPVVTSSSLDMDFRGMFYVLENPNDTIVNYAAYPVVREYDRMVYLALSEYFFDSGMYAYYKAGVFSMQIANERMPKDLEMLLRTTYFGTIMMLNPALMEAPISLELEVSTAPRCVIKTSGATVAVTAVVTVMMLPAGQTPVQLSSMTMEAKLNAKVSMKGKKLAVHMDLRRFKIYSNQSALESLALIPLQGPLKTMLQISIVPIINNRTKKGVQIPLPEGMDFIEEVVEYHNGFIIIGANLHFTKGLREVIESNRQYMPSNSTLAP
ncbi:phospholipid transfer protein [Scleropages formosus]|uniref:Phospholipid transfer protein n=1 Tax=Scleropages formosus TaxID=113540 RepID=A0A8D0C910_SCLFO|nr:phospholipid transfer protein [Scleropages formosus]XP_018611412.1 phospholipid transfer protein [Scleropages formosus]XP_018611413.1 phospholipid transfer protein [Scleropages formosus]XP_018611414.1 phospholipid transfer protein [Scleropages formosus]XP_018611415.1 phospholipid transfer protein [Scleropages formosus]XP_018611418.1 phospholipid transfer protein [Scleropages formosus]